MYYDFHLHSEFSGDCNTSLEDMILKAISLNLPGICITDHQDTDNPYDGELFEIDFPPYFDLLNTYKEKYKNQIEIFIGVELGLQQKTADFHNELVNKYDFDFVIGSNHLINGLDPYFPEYFKTYEESAGYQQYFDSIYENISVFKDFDVFGHLDYIVRYGPNQNKYFSYEKYSSSIDKILHLLVENNIGLEINTGGFKYGLGHPNPHEDILKKYYDLGGRIITLGSDAHFPEYVAYEFDKAVAILKKCGFKEYYIFKKRKAVAISI